MAPGAHGWQSARVSDAVSRVPSPDGPYFEELRVGQVLDPAPALTIGPGEAAVYQSICGDPLATSLSRPVAEAVTGQPGALVNPALVLHVSIGQSTVATRQVIANLFYRGVALRQPVRLGETLRSTVTIRGLRELSRRDDRPARGLVLLGIHTTCLSGDEAGSGATVVHYERCAMLRFRDQDVTTGHDDDLGAADPEVNLGAWTDLAPDWDAMPLRTSRPTAPSVGERRTDPLRDTVTNAPALARLSQNLAAVHRDQTLGPTGRRLVYGGHTIGLAQASLCRMQPGTGTVVGWQSCEHPSPVFEEDILSFHHTVLDERPSGSGRLRAIRIEVDAERSDGSIDAVLDWRLVTWGA